LPVVHSVEHEPRPSIPGMRRVCFVRFEVGAGDVSATAVGVGHRLPAECSISVTKALELAAHYPVVVHRTVDTHSAHAA
jgi:hypothetical protein